MIPVFLRCLAIALAASWMTSKCFVVPNAFAQSSSRFKALPPKGITIGPAIKAELIQEVRRLQEDIDRTLSASKQPDRWADATVPVRAVKMALLTDGFYRKSEIKFAKQCFELSRKRLQSKSGDDDHSSNKKSTSEESMNLSVHGYRSRIDGSAQPFGLVIPKSFDANQKGLRLDVWLHGRGDNKTELAFLSERLKRPGQYPPTENDTIVLHPFGRHCNAFKFAGEVDVFEAIERVKRMYDIDPRRITIRGFSMGGAGVWHLSAHHPKFWAFSNPGAGFVDTIEYQGWQDKSPLAWSPVRRSLLRWYDVPPWVGNLKNLQVIAYSGEKDKQKLAADTMLKQAKQAGFEIAHQIGPGMGHKIDELSAKTIQQKIDLALESPSKAPKVLDLTTYTTRYPGNSWAKITGLKKHWTKGHLRASRQLQDRRVEIQVDGVTHVSLNLTWLESNKLTIRYHGIDYAVEDQDDNQDGFQTQLMLLSDELQVTGKRYDQTPRKRPGLQGPIDDAFCDSFLFVIPTRPAKHGLVERWIQRELEFAKSRWRGIMRGNVNVVRDVDVTEQMAKKCHLICFGDFGSNVYLKKVANRLPIRWDQESVSAGSKTFPASHSVAAFIYPNPLAPNRYLVANSGMTFREFSNVSNSRQIAMLGDWAILDVTQPDDDVQVDGHEDGKTPRSDKSRHKDDLYDDGIYPGQILAEGFFDESWRL